ncbi:LysM peptidoglycan-binding and 3D domain-containing protein [Heyndrickxia acidiproducens]|uniref:LysM peptidoglycan-binding and 3D domain-containing protein n=1 Tax=Heyndrickxia acidiproducens TaxID=1121084 RepID=UPI0003607659|nr:3D domain-containing protein [Heyndrickxia acidiproducens]
MKKAVTAFATAVTLTGAMAANASAAVPDTHVVEKGDTLWGISQKYDTSIQHLKQVNQLSSDIIYPRQKINISTKKVYVIKAGDTLSEISNKYGVTVEQLRNWNDLPSNIIFPNQEIVIQSNPRSKVTVKEASVDVSVQGKTDTRNAKTEVKKPNVEVKSQPEAPANEAKEEVKKPDAEVKSQSSTASGNNTQPRGKTITVTATAYTGDCAGCSGITATGINVKSNPNAKVIAVDPNVIPLGSKVYVEGYGTAVAGDTGGAIQGNRIDVLVPDTGTARNWGRKTVKVTVLD